MMSIVSIVSIFHPVDAHSTYVSFGVSAATVGGSLEVLFQSFF